ncbi:MAG: HTH domain-containing protein [Clostridia bacterium]|nr:HTH domain-containing protein [Clostridia bacterium]
MLKQYLVFGIFLFIIQKEKITAKIIAEKFEISKRTVYRYLDTLTSAGIPVICEQGRNGGIRILKSFKLNNIYLTENEKSIIKQALIAQKERGIFVDNIIEFFS